MSHDHPTSRKPQEKDFTGSGLAGFPLHRGHTGNPDIDQKVTALVEEWSCGDHQELIEELIITALHLGHDLTSTGDLRLINRAVKEMRKANNAFQPYDHRQKVSVYGSARTEPDLPEYQAAVEFSKRMAELDFMVITGAGDGIMGAANAGAGREASFGLNIDLPFEQDANPTIRGDHKLVSFNYFFTRKLSFVKEADAVALFPGGFGTMDEGFEQLTLIQTGKSTIVPIVMVDAPGGTYWKTWRQFLEEHLLRRGLVSPEDFSLFKVTDDIDEAVQEITSFYRVFHSYRWVGKQLVIRLKKRLQESALRLLDSEFSDLFKQGSFRIGEAMRAEKNQPELADLPRLICHPHRNKFGRFRRLIDRINELGE